MVLLVAVSSNVIVVDDVTLQPETFRIVIEIAFHLNVYYSQYSIFNIHKKYRRPTKSYIQIIQGYLGQHIICLSCFFFRDIWNIKRMKDCFFLYNIIQFDISAEIWATSSCLKRLNIRLPFKRRDRVTLRADENNSFGGAKTVSKRNIIENKKKEKKNMVPFK